jgi:hypothetical protein
MTGARHRVHASLAEREYAAVLARARRERVTMANYLRRCLNAVALEEDDHAVLVEEVFSGQQPFESTSQSETAAAREKAAGYRAKHDP